MIGTATDADTAALKSYLSERLGTTVTGTEVLHEGLNLSLAISTDGNDWAYVLRRPKELRRTSPFDDLRHEYGLLRELDTTAIPTPTPVLFCEDDSVVGEPLFLTTYLGGAAIRLGSELPEPFQDPQSRWSVATDLIDTLAAIHSLDAVPFEDVCERRSPREGVARTAERLDEATSVTGHELPALRSVEEWLRRNAPSDSTAALVHGDFRPSNVLFAGTDRPEISGVLDWETAFLGDPLTDLGYLLLRWRDDGDPTPPLDDLEAKYPEAEVIGELRDANENGLSPFTSKSGSPDRRELVSRYEDRTGMDFSNERFYRAYAAFGLATVWEDLHRHRIEAGAASSSKPI